MKKQYIDQRKFNILLSALIFILTACSDNTIYPATTALSVTLTISPTSPTTTAIPSPTQTAIATRMPISTLPAEAADARVLEFLKTNASCSLPCWWGITPGITSTDEIQSVLEPLLGAVVSDVRFKFSETGGHLLMSPQPNGLEVEIQYLVKDNVVSMVYIYTEMTKDIYDKVYDDPLYWEIMSAYTLKAVLTKYGKPDQILIRSFSDLAGEFNPTQTLLYYPKVGIIAQYFSPNGLLKENGVFVLPTCPPRSHISLRLFNPDSQMSLDQLLAIDDSFSKYKDISEATNMNSDTFFQAYKEYDEKSLKSSCPAVLKTPEDIWPSEYSNP